MIHTLVNHLNFNGIYDYGDDIILGSAAEISDINLCTKGYLYHLPSITHSLPDNYQQIPIEAYLKYIKCLIEATSSGLSDMTPVTVNTKDLDSYIA